MIRTHIIFSVLKKFTEELQISKTQQYHYVKYVIMHVFLGIWANSGGRDNTIYVLESQRLLRMRGICVRNKRKKELLAERVAHVVTRKEDKG